MTLTLLDLGIIVYLLIITIETTISTNIDLKNNHYVHIWGIVLTFIIKLITTPFRLVISIFIELFNLIPFSK